MNLVLHTRDLFRPISPLMLNTYLEDVCITEAVRIFITPAYCKDTESIQDFINYKCKLVNYH